MHPFQSRRGTNSRPSPWPHFLVVLGSGLIVRLKTMEATLSLFRRYWYVVVFIFAMSFQHSLFSLSQMESGKSGLDHNGCKRLELPQRRDNIPLPPEAYEMDRGQSNNFVMGILDRKTVQMEEGQPPLLIHIALPRPTFSSRIDEKTGRFDQLGNSENTWDRASACKAEDGIFIDVGGFVGGSSIPSAALGIDTYVFEPVRRNTNLIHASIFANECRISEHLTVINALVGDKNSPTEWVYVTDRTDNAAATKAQATKSVGNSEIQFEQPAHMIKLDNFFPSGTKVQNMKIDVRGFELHVLRGAERLLKENKGSLQVRFEYDEGLFKAAGTNPPDVLKFMEDLGYKIISKKGDDIDWK